MGKIKKYKNSVEAFLSGEKGQRFFNFAYSIGAAVVIWGALFKILHLPGGNALLSIGMGTEVLMFVLTAFDRPPKEYHWEEVFPVLSSNNLEDRPDFTGGGGGAVIVGGGGEAAEGGTITINGAGAGTAGVVAGVAGNVEGMTDVNEQYVTQVAAINEQMEQLRQTTEALNHVSSVLLESYRAITDNSENITSSSTGYVEQMTSLNRNIAGLNTIYEIQLKSISSQLDNIDKVNQGLKAISHMYEQSASESNRYCEETHKMAQYMQQLNSVYEKMITAMTINMYRPMVNPDDLTPRQPQAPAADTDNNQ
ncbi:MAG: gliding motility protein GldL [Bacteroidales bacterium]|nr:gliding motility protein GldL [Bacteroidales bacterium]